MQRVQRRFGYWILVGFGVGVATGTVLAIVLTAAGLSPLVENLGVFRTKVIWGLWQLATFLALWTATLLLLVRRPHARHWIVPLALLAGTNLLYHFPPLFTILSAAHYPAQPVTASGFRALMLQPNVLAMWAHAVLASIAVSGLVLARLCVPPDGRPGRAASGYRPDELLRTARRATMATLLATVAQLPAGVWVLVSQTRLAQFQLTGQDLWASGTLAASVLLSLLLVFQLFELWGEVNVRRVRRCSLLLVLIVVLMCGTLIRLRQLQPPLRGGSQPPATEQHV